MSGVGVLVKKLDNLSLYAHTRASFHTIAVERMYRMRLAGKHREEAMSKIISNPSEGGGACWANDLPLFGFMSAHRVL